MSLELGFSQERGGWITPAFADMHAHLREGPMMKLVVPETALLYRLAVAMPNLATPISTPQEALAYRKNILEVGRRARSDLDVTVPLYLQMDTSHVDVYRGHERGAWRAVKMYPRAATTNSAHGIDFHHLEKLDSVFAVMERLGMVLSIHAELPFDEHGKAIDPFEREWLALPLIERTLERHPRLKIVIEHVSSKKAVDFVEHMEAIGYDVMATVAPHYLVWNRGHLFEGGMNPARFSIPILKTEEDRLWLVDFTLTSDRVFLGTDSAPHLVEKKRKDAGAAGGVFNTPVSLSVYFSVFRNSRREDWFERFVNFACRRGPQFYGFDTNDTPDMLITEVPWNVPQYYKDGDGTTVVPMHSRETAGFYVERL